ncbi:MAG TPA: transporter substrate-binding domain-containing protein, partial [Rhodocyclaceae bacterium]|nr:transporter substrate-binding domain-containing protein [Rhodocyclaceae bacterium]
MKRLALPVAAALTIAGTLVAWNSSKPLPPPQKGKQELIVLVQPGPLTYDQSDPQATTGLEHDLVNLFADELGVKATFLASSPNSLARDFSSSKVHLAAAWLTPGMLPGSRYSSPFAHSHDLLVQHEASYPIDEESELGGRQLHVVAGSRQAATAKSLKERIPDIELIEHPGMLPLTLLEAVATGRYELALVDESFHDVALQFAPSLQATMRFSRQPIVWAFPEGTHPDLIAKAEAFLQRIPKEPVFERLKDRYFGHIRRLSVEDISKLLERSRTVLPKLKPYFQSAQIETGFDWRLLAALAYQESQWEAGATSPTGVRGIMMLTEETA